MAISWSVCSMRRHAHRARALVTLSHECTETVPPRRHSHTSSHRKQSFHQETPTNVTVPLWATEAALYLHWPYCEKRCTYCNFNKYISQSVDEYRMRKCLLLETRTLIERSYVTKMNSIFFGGGTPSLAPASTIGAVIDLTRALCSIPQDAEVTLEANPTSTEMSKLGAFREAGVNRISIGLQALNDSDLKILGRHHSVQEAVRCVAEAKVLFPGRTSVDVIFGRPGQSVGAWQKEMDKVLELCDDHVSLYQLTLERGTRLFKQVQQGDLSMPSPDEMADMYECTVDTLEAAGFHRYEASNFARNQGAESSHNKNYWHGGQYIGVGPGAHGRYMLRGSEGGSLVRGAFTQTLEPIPWMVEVELGGHATRRAVTQHTAHILEEMLMLGLRTTEGVPQQRWVEMGGVLTLLELFGPDPHVQALIQQGLLRLDQSGIVASPSGLNVIDSITTHLIYLLQDKLAGSECYGSGGSVPP